MKAYRGQYVWYYQGVISLTSNLGVPVKVRKSVPGFRSITQSSVRTREQYCWWMMVYLSREIVFNLSSLERWYQWRNRFVGSHWPSGTKIASVKGHLAPLKTSMPALASSGQIQSTHDFLCFTNLQIRLHCIIAICCTWGYLWRLFRNCTGKSGVQTPPLAPGWFPPLKFCLV